MDHKELSEAFERFVSLGNGPATGTDQAPQVSDAQVEKRPQRPLHLPDKLKDCKLRDGLTFDVAELEAQIGKGWRLAEQAKAQAQIFDHVFEKQMGTFATLEKLHDEMEKLRLELYNLQKDCHSLFKIKLERQAAAQEARAQASQLIWTRVKSLHATVAKERGFTVAAAVVEVVIDFLRSQPADALVEQVKGLPETREALLTLAGGKSALSERVDAALRQHRSVDLSAQASVLADVTPGADNKYKPPARSRAKQQEQENIAAKSDEEAAPEAAAGGEASPPGFARTQARRQAAVSGHLPVAGWQPRYSGEHGLSRMPSAGRRH